MDLLGSLLSFQGNDSWAPLFYFFCFSCFLYCRRCSCLERPFHQGNTFPSWWLFSPVLQEGGRFFWVQLCLFSIACQHSCHGERPPQWRQCPAGSQALQVVKTRDALGAWSGPRFGLDPVLKTWTAGLCWFWKKWERKERLEWEADELGLWQAAFSSAGPFKFKFQGHWNMVFTLIVYVIATLKLWDEIVSDLKSLHVHGETSLGARDDDVACPRRISSLSPPPPLG